MKQPALGIALPVNVTRVIDGDTVCVRIGESCYEWRIRLDGINAPELSQTGGLASKQYLQNLLFAAKEIIVHIPVPKNKVNLLANLTFDRIPGYLFADGESVNERMVTDGMAKKAEPKKK